MHLGYKGRLNGPVDNPASSCLSCHATAQSPQFRPITPDTGKPSDLSAFFRNVPSGESFDGLPTSASMDYSLQLAGGIAAALANRPGPGMSMRPGAAEVKKIEYFITSMEDSVNTQPHRPSAHRATGRDNTVLHTSQPPLQHHAAWILGLCAVIPVLLVLGMSKKN